MLFGVFELTGAVIDVPFMPHSSHRNKGEHHISENEAKAYERTLTADIQHARQEGHEDAGHKERIGQDLQIHRRTVCEVPGGVGEFDGMTIDRRDHLWVGVWDGGCLYEVDPAVGVVGTVKLPVSRGTCCTFTGSDLKTLVITSAAKEIDLVKEPLAGFTLKMEMPAEGRATYRFPNI